MGGFFGAVSRTNCAADVFYGTDYHSHLGTHRGGMAVWACGAFHRRIHDISNAPFRTRFGSDFEAFSKMDPRSGIGVISDTDDQPHVFLSHLGRYSIVSVGLVANADELVRGLIEKHAAHFSSLQSGEIMQTEIVAALINTQNTIEEGIRHVQNVVKGSISLLLLAPDNVLYAARDRWGRTPIVIGRKPEGYAAAFESSSFPNLGYETYRELGPGEVAKITVSGVETVLPPLGTERLCSFLYVYYGYPASTYGGRNVEHVRYRCGAALSATAPVEADSVGAIPDSGISHALGYADKSGIKYSRPYVKYTPTWPRSFMPTTQAERQHVAQMKLIPIPELINGKRLVLCDDSIVRGTQLRDQTKRVFDAGAKEVHVRIACPPLLFGCPFINFSRSKSEMDLITRRIIRDLDGEGADPSKYLDPDGEPYGAMVDRIRERLGLTSLAFQRLPDLLDAIGTENVCTYCWSGKDPAL
ncbi:MAG: amidophosphoribosyltransferase [Kiritimatiellae bacterium]|nr:amidophosphoribosyltransferase [Kiritimatiellia bacterium]